MSARNRTTNSKSLKRVSGELQIAPVQLDLHRPPTAGSPLKRCSNDTDLNLTFSQENVICREEGEEAVKDEQEDKVTVPLYNFVGDGNEESSTQESMISNLDLDNTAHSTPPCSSEGLKWDEGHHEEMERCEDEPRQSHQDQLVHSNMEERLALQSIPTFFHSQRTSILSSRLTIRDGGKNKPLRLKQVNTVITTATTLGLPGSVRGYSSETPSPVWSLQNQIGTKGSAPSPPSLKSSTSSPSKEANRSKLLGDGDTSCSSPTGSREVPPNSPAMSEIDKPPFMLTFRRPKPLPRSRITSSRGSSRQYSLPTTASTPNPVSQPGPQPSNSRHRVVVVAPDPNNNQPEPQLDPNNNEEVNNNEAAKDKKEEGDDKKCEERERSLLAILEKPIPDPAATGVIAQAAKTSIDWEDDDSESAKKKKEEGGSLTESGSSYGSGSGSYSGSGSSDPTKSKTSRDPTAAAFVQTEKGAIRFHLPGRIQHKTTIKVAHFPVNSNNNCEDKPVFINVKPEGCEGEGEEDILPQNFGIPPMPQMPEIPFGYNSPPQPYGPYSYPPYGYPQQPPPQPYYYGYPPYY